MRQTLSIAAFFITAFTTYTPSATAGFIGGVSGTSAVMLGSTGPDAIVITTEGTAWLAHNRFTVGDPGFVSNIDFDSTQAGEQRIPNNGQGSVNVVGAAGFDTLGVFDGTLINANNAMRIREDQVSLGNNRPIVYYSGFQKVNLRPQGPGMHNSGVFFESTSSDATYETLGSVNQYYWIGDPVTRTLDNIQGSIYISAGGRVDLDDSENTGNHTYTVDLFNRITRTGIADFDLYLSSRIRIFPGSGNNQFIIEGNTTPHFEIYGGGTNTINVGDAHGSLNDIRQPVLINPSGGGTDIVTFNDSAASEAHEYTVVFNALIRNDAIIAEGTMDQLTLNCGPFSDTIWAEPAGQAHIDAGAGSSWDLMIFNLLFYPGLTTVNGDTSTIIDPQFQPVSFSGIDHLYLFGGKEANSLGITPSAQYLITADAGDAAIAPADSLKLEASGLPFIQTADAFLVLGKKLVNFYGFESVEGPPAPPPPPPPPADGADLTGSFAGVTAIPDSKGRFKLTAQFNQHNAGNQGAGKSVTRFFLSADTTISPDDLILKTQKIKLLALGQQRAILFKKKLPATINPAGMYIIARVDDLNQVADRDRANNQVLFGPIF